MSHDRHVIRHQVQEMRFGFLSDADIRAVSVKQISSPATFDALNHPLPGGLYDPALGPTNPHNKCVTCGQDTAECPGHMGHVELAVPVYHPLLFPVLFKMLRTKCLFCHKLRLDARKTRTAALKMALTDAGESIAARQLDVELKGATYQPNTLAGDMALLPDPNIAYDAVSVLCMC